ncbi:MAG: phosphate acyltransferase PlsX [Cryobacterium sp.]|nr:phosphate acyltransferase PlsX [Oligoflexia bacterium]
MSRLLLDVMGGDHAPSAILDGALLALEDLQYPLVLLGDEEVIRAHPIAQHLDQFSGKSAPFAKVTLIHAPDIIGMEDKIKALRSKPNAPINVGTKLVAESWAAFHAGTGTPDAFISAGHSGAVMASALLTLGRIRGAERPAIATRLPTTNGKGVICLDVGANVDCKPEHIRDFAIMGALLCSALSPATSRPKVSILANGEERTKGNDTTRAAYALLESHPLFQAGGIGEFVGYSEAKEMFKGDVDVVTMDGFIGNLILKNSEALGSALLQIMKTEAKKNPLNRIGFGLAFGALKSFKKKVDFREVGAAPLLGVKGYIFIAHGRSDRIAIRNSLLRAQEALQAKMVERLEVALAPTFAVSAPVTT